MRADKRMAHQVYLQRLSDCLLWMEVKREDNRLSIIGNGAVSFSSDAESGDSSHPEVQVSFQDAVTQIRKQLHLGWFSEFDVSYIAPSHRLTARFLETPPAEEENIRDLVSFEVSEALQLTIEDVAWDMIISSHHGNETAKQLLWIATRKEYVHSLLQEWPENILIPTQITPDFWAIYEFVLAREETLLEEPCLIISLEGDRATLTLATHRAIYLTRSVSLERSLSAGSVRKDAASMHERILTLEIERTLSYASDRIPHGSIHTMLLCGFGDWERNTLQSIAEKNNLSARMIGIKDIQGEFTLTDGLSLEPAYFPMLCMAYCQLELGIRGPNLLDEKEEPSSWRNMVPNEAIPSKKFMAIAGGLAGFTLFLWLAGTIWYSHAKAVRLEEGKELITIAQQLRREEAGLREMNRTDVNYADLFIFLSEKLPKEILVKSINLDIKSGVDLILVGGSYRTTAEIVETLNESQYFREIVEERAVNEKDGFTIYLTGKLQPGN